MMLAGKTAVVTGASRGIGRAVAKRFFKEGANIIAIARNGTVLTEMVFDTQITDCSKKIVGQICNVSQEREVKALFDAIALKDQTIDVLVNAAGIAEIHASIFESEFSEWKKVFETNVFGTFLTMKYAIPLMRKNRQGKIINFYGGGDGPLPGFSAYSASKAAVARLTETIAKEIKPFGIDANVIAPGPVKTELFVKMFSQCGENPPPVVNVEKAVELALFLASEKSNGLTGKFISAVWDNWQKIPENLDIIMGDPDVFTLRRRKGEL